MDFNQDTYRKWILPALGVAETIATKGRSPGAVAMSQEGIFRDVEEGQARKQALAAALVEAQAKAQQNALAAELGPMQLAEARRGQKSAIEDEARKAALINQIKSDLGLDDSSRAIATAYPEKYAASKLTIPSNIYLPTTSGYVAMPNKGDAQPKPMMVGGKPLMPQPTQASKSPEQLQEDEAAKKRGAAEVPKALSPADLKIVKMKITSLKTAQRQLETVKAAYEKIKDSSFSGKGRGWIPSEGNDAFENATAALKPTIQAMTRVPGIGSMSDFESKLAMAPYPSAGSYNAVNEQAIQGLQALIDESLNGYTLLAPVNDGGEVVAGPAQSGTIWRRAKNGVEYEYDSNTKTPTGKSR